MDHGTVEVWTEVAAEGIVLTWVWDGFSLGVVVSPMDGYHLTPDDAAALSRYSENKEFDLTVDKMYDESDFEGTIEEFVKEELAVE